MRGHPTIQRPLRVAHVRVLRLDRELVLQKALQALVVGTELLKIDVAAAVLVDTLELVGDVVCDLVLGYTEMMEIHLDDHIRHLHQRDLAVAVAIVLVKDLADTRGLVLRLGDCGQVQPRRSGLGEWCVETGTGEGGREWQDSIRRASYASRRYRMRGSWVGARPTSSQANSAALA